MRGDINRQCLEKILSYSDRAIALLKKCNYDYETFRSDEFYLSISMIEMQIGEITNHFTTEFKTETKDEIPWNLIKSMRNLFAHAYDGMDSKVIWDTAVNDIPILKSFCETYLKENLGEESDDLHY
ncbi:MAG: DUF86 domain-containing protein [Ruminococcus sp.]|jgi:uncharacterized protein with HEPN domain|nr:DUF86 domain-containing protein [Ruminococcus sp.]